MIDQIRGKTVLVVGMARSGVAAALLLAEMGARKVIITDRKSAEELPRELAQLQKYPCIEPVTGQNSPDLITAEVVLVVKSPGVPPSLEILRRAASLQISVLSEIELAYAFIKAPLIGITGTNGKTTTTALTAEMLREARFKEVVTAGNIGVPLAGVVGKNGPAGVIVAELSSFQLDNIRNFRPAVAVFLNFKEDHLDYHGSIDCYFRAKARILENQVAGDFAVLNAGDPAVASLRDAARGSVLWFAKGKVSQGAGLDSGMLSLFNPGGEVEHVCSLKEIALPGEHNLENALAAAAAAWGMGADPPAIGRALRAFRGIEHRLEFVESIGGVDFINDSKGTNPSSTIPALKSFPGKPKILIAGGKDKGGDFSDLADVIRREVKYMVLLGETREKLAVACERAGFRQYRLVDSLAEAVETAWMQANPGDLVLLSPACASWDMFTDFEARGNLFKKLVRNLKSLQENGKGADQ